MRNITRNILLLITAMLVSGTLYAQVSLSLNFNVDQQPAWGPTGYDHVRYYYLPDIEVYYSVSQHLYFYYDAGRWVGRSRLPYRYRNYDLYNSYKVVVNESRPYRNHRTYRDKYSSYRDRHDQEPIRDSRDSRYFVNKNHPEHKNWLKQQRRGNRDNNGRGNNRDGNNGRDRDGNNGRDRDGNKNK